MLRTALAFFVGVVIGSSLFYFLLFYEASSIHKKHTDIADEFLVDINERLRNGVEIDEDLLNDVHRLHVRIAASNKLHKARIQDIGLISLAFFGFIGMIVVSVFFCRKRRLPCSKIKILGP